MAVKTGSVELADLDDVREAALNAPERIDRIKQHGHSQQRCDPKRGPVKWKSEESRSITFNNR